MSTEAVHWNRDTQETGEFHRRDFVLMSSPRPNRIDLDWMKKRIVRGEVSAVFDEDQRCLVLFEDGYWLDLYFDEITNTGEKGHGFSEMYIVPCNIWD